MKHGLWDGGFVLFLVKVRDLLSSPDSTGTPYAASVDTELTESHLPLLPSDEHVS